MLAAALIAASAVDAALAGGARRGFGKASSPVSKSKLQNMEQLLLRTLHVQDVWERMSSAVHLFDATTHAVEVRPSSTHGLGLFACGALPKDSLATFYPVHAIGAGDDICLTSGKENLAYFGSEGDDDSSAPYRLEPTHGCLANWAADMWLDVNPTLADQPGWLAHRANDAAMCEGALPCEDAILAYYSQCQERANAVMVPFGGAVPLMCLWTTRAVAAGEEIFQIYGHDYWISRQGSTVPPYTKPVLRAADRGWKAAVRRATTETMPALLSDEMALLEGIMAGQ